MNYRLQLLRSTLALAFILCARNGIAQTRATRIALDIIQHFRESSAPVYNADPERIWPEQGSSVDSVLWSTFLPVKHHLSDSDTVKCPPVGGKLYILEKRTGDTVKICLSKAYNHFLDTEIIISYPYDSLKKWTNKTIPDWAIPKIKINVPYCINNQAANGSWNFYLLATNMPGVSFNEHRLNEIPLFISSAEVRVADLDSARLYFYEPYMLSADYSTAHIEIKEHGQLQTDKITDKLHYKSSYKIMDTLVIGKKLFKIDSISRDWNYVYVRTLGESKSILKLPEQDMRLLQPYFTNGKEEMVVDFWGTWCAPCIATMPQLKALYEKTSKTYCFLSICFDDVQNSKKSKRIVLDHGIKWPQLYNDRKDLQNITHHLAISCFPTYMIINRKGDIIFSSCGADGFKELEEIVLRRKGQTRP